MDPRIKTLLQELNIYHPLQSSYRSTRGFITKQYYKLTYRRYKGSGYTCNFCGAAYKRFVPEYPTPDIRKAIDDNTTIAGFGENVYCPTCLSRNRERLIRAVIEKYLPPAPATRILHFSPEKQLHVWLKDKASVITADYHPGFYTRIDPQIRQADATQLTWPDDSFDLLIANHILEHIPDDRRAMRELCRVLSNNGVAILQVPYSPTLPATLEEPGIDDSGRQAALFGQKDHVRIYALADYLQRLRSAGFHVRVLSPDELTEFRRFAIQENESVFLCYKQ